MARHARFVPPVPAPPTRDCPVCGHYPRVADEGGHLEVACVRACEGTATRVCQGSSPEEAVARWNVYASHRFMRAQRMGRGVYPGPVRSSSNWE